MILLLWLQQRSINAYWVQTYHQNSPLSVFDNNPVWRAGGEISGFLSKQLSLLQDEAVVVNDNTVASFNERFLTTADLLAVATQDNTNTSVYQLIIDTKALFKMQLLYIFPQKPFIKVVKIDPAEAQGIAQDNVLVINKADEGLPYINTVNAKGRLLIGKGQKVFFVGDSLMQGVAPHAMRTLLRQHGIESINLSKQSTGLSYPRFYNWPEVARDTFTKNPDIKLMVVFMGPNDPWDFPVVKGKRFFRFNTSEWEGVYRARIQHLINAATEHGAQVLWIGAPNVKDSKLNAGIIQLNRIYQSQVTIAKQRYIPSNDVLGMKDNQFVKFMQIPNGGNVTLRTDDGIHFTIIGQKRIADKIISLLRFDDSTEQVNK